MTMYNLIEYSDNYSKTTRSLWQFYKDNPNDNIIQSESFKPPQMPLQKTVTLSTQDNAKLLQQLKSCFKRTINWNEYDSEPKTSARNIYLNHLINSSFQGAFNLSSSKSRNKKLQCYD